MIAAHYLPSWEIIDCASAAKIDAPSGTTRELAEELATISQNDLSVSLEHTHGPKEARGQRLKERKFIRYAFQVIQLRLKRFLGYPTSA